MRTTALLLLPLAARGNVHSELEAMRSWWCEGPTDHAAANAETVVCLRFRRHALPHGTPERAALKAKIEQVQASESAPAMVEEMHSAWCRGPGDGTHICRHHAVVNHACNVTAGLMSESDDAEKLYVERVHAGCMGDKDEL